MLSKKRLILLAAGAASAVLFGVAVPGSASAETNRRLCGAKFTLQGKAAVYIVAKVPKGDGETCEEAVKVKAPEELRSQQANGALTDPEFQKTDVRLATCEDVFKDLGFSPGTDGCPEIAVSPDPEDVSVTVLPRAI